VNELTDITRFDPISGFPIYKTLLCRVSKSDSSHLSERNPDVEASIEEDACPVPHPAAPDDAARRVYLDYNATTFVAPDVREAMLPFFSATGGNPSSIHSAGNLARAAVDVARRIIAQGLMHCPACGVHRRRL
jgi:selenocysteine lyase/cysteine desulfurase